MNRKVEIFNHEQFGEIRTVYNNGNDDIWFVGKDIATQLGYHSYQNMFKIIDKEDKIEINPQSQSYQGLGNNGSTLEPNPNIFRMMLINESGLYSAIFGSQLPRAKEFKRWITSEVLPSIRKHGGYIMNQEKMSPEMLMANALKVADNIIKENELKLEKANNKLKIQEPKVEYHDEIISGDNYMTITSIAKTLGFKSGIQLNKILNALNIQYKQGGVWNLYSEYTMENTGVEYAKLIPYHIKDENRNSYTLKWTELGKRFIYDKLKENELLPIQRISE